MAKSTWTDYYALLELYDPIHRSGKGPDASVEEIKEAWKFQIQAWHPDKFRAGTTQRAKAEERTKLINKAYGVLRDPGTKGAYDKEWLKRNAWFREEREAGSSGGHAVTPEIAVIWDPPDAQSDLFYNIPRGIKRRARLTIQPRVGRGFLVEILEPEAGWLKVIEPKDKRGIPPFTAVIEVDTTNLVAERSYVCDLEFVLEDL